MGTHLLGSGGVSLGSGGNISTLDVQEDGDIGRNGLDDLQFN